MALLVQSCNKGGTESGNGEKVTLQLNLKQGDVFKLMTSTRQSIKQSVMGMATTIQQNNDMYLKQEVTKVNEKGDATLQVTYERIVSTTENAMTGKMTFDSDKDTVGEGEMAAAYKPLIGATFSYTLDKQGKVLAVEGMDALMDKVLAGAGDELQSQTMKKTFEQMFGEESMTSMMQGMNAIYPTTQIGVGDTWGAENTLGGGMGMVLKNTFKLENIEADKSVVSMTGEISTDASSGIEISGISVSYSLEGNSEGTMEIDRKSGMVLNSKTTQKIKGSVKTMGMNVPMEIDQTVEVKPY